MLQPADEAPPPAPVPLPTEDDEAAAREAHPEAAAALQRAEDALAWAKQTVEAAFVLRHKARALRQIGEFIVGPLGSAQREEAARFAEVSHLFVAPARLDEIR